MERKGIEEFKQVIILLLYFYLSFFLLDIIRILFTYNENNINYLNIISTDQNINIYGKLYMFLKVVSNIFLLLGVLQFIKIIRKFNRETFFENGYVQRFKKTGKLFIYSSLVSGINLVFELFLSNTLFVNSDRMYYKYFIAIVGCFFLLVYRILKKGQVIKEENDLTI